MPPGAEPLDGLGAALSGPPRSFELDGDIYALGGSWRPLLEHLPRGQWELGLLLDVTDPEDADVLAERLADPGDPLTLDDVQRIAEALVEAATGWAYWTAQRLIAWAAQHWPDLDGIATLRGVDLVALVDAAPARACNAIYALLLEGVTEEKERRSIEAQLHRPPPGVDAAAAPGWDEGASFLAAMSAAPRRG
jgi:hypothetical protein